MELFNLTHLCLHLSSISTLWTDRFSVVGYQVSFYFYLYRNHVFNANSADPDQTPCIAASDMGLHCLPMSFSETPDTNEFSLSLSLSLSL